MEVKMKKKKNLTYNDIKKVIELHKKNIAVSDIAKLVDTSRQIVYDIINELDGQKEARQNKVSRINLIKKILTRLKR